MAKRILATCLLSLILLSIAAAEDNYTILEEVVLPETCSCDPDVIIKFHRTESGNSDSCEYYLDVFTTAEACSLAKIKITDEDNVGTDLVPTQFLPIALNPPGNYQPALAGIRVAKFSGVKKISVYFYDSSGVQRCSFSDSLQGCECDCADTANISTGISPCNGEDPILLAVKLASVCLEQAADVQVTNDMTGNDIIPISDLKLEQMEEVHNDYKIYKRTLAGPNYKGVTPVTVTLYDALGNPLCTLKDTIIGCNDTCSCDPPAINITVKTSDQVCEDPAKCCYKLQINLDPQFNPCMDLKKVEIVDGAGNIVLPGTDLNIAPSGLSVSLDFMADAIYSNKPIKIKIFKADGTQLECEYAQFLPKCSVPDYCCGHIIVTAVPDIVNDPNCQCSYKLYVKQDVPNLQCQQLIKSARIRPWAFVPRVSVQLTAIPVEPFPMNPTDGLGMQFGTICYGDITLQPWPPIPNGMKEKLGVTIEFLDANGKVVCSKILEDSVCHIAISDPEARMSPPDDDDWENVKIYPNPVSEEVSIFYSLEKDQQISVAVYDSKGAKVDIITNRLFQKGEHLLKYNTGHLAEGMYLIRITGETFSQNAQLVKTSTK